MTLPLENTSAPETASPAPPEIVLLLTLAFLMAGCAFVYELAFAALAARISGDPNAGYSLAVGVFVAALGLGAWASQGIHGRLPDILVRLESAVGLVGGAGPAVLQALPGRTAPLCGALTLIILTGLLVGTEIPIITRLLGEGRLAAVLAADYFGGLAGSVVFGLVLAPRIGPAGASLAAGLTSMGAGLICLGVLGGRLEEAGRTRLYWAAAAGLLAAAWLAAGGRP